MHVTGSHRCPSCDTQTTRTAMRCSNPACRAELGLCSHCKDLVTARAGRPGLHLRRERLVCERCGEQVVRCRTSQVGGACNGLARTSGWYAHQLCDDCSSRVAGFAARVGVVALGTAAGYLLRRGRR